MRKKGLRGFTLIELLVVIAIIGVLSSVVLASLNTARAKARDAQRASELKQFVNALELYANDHGGAYPVPANPGTGCGGTRAGYCLNDSTVKSALVPTYMPDLPTDPKYTDTTNDYLYQASVSSGSWVYVLLRRSEANNNWCLPPVSAYWAAHGWNSTYPKC